MEANLETGVLDSCLNINSVFINDYLKKKDVKWIVLAGFLKKIPKELIEEFENKILNIHPALLPKFGGKGM